MRKIPKFIHFYHLVMYVWLSFGFHLHTVNTTIYPYKIDLFMPYWPYLPLYEPICKSVLN